MSDTEPMINVVPQPPPPDPDAEATVHDFLDYTEYLHNDVARSLRLIGTLDHDYQRLTGNLEALCIRYGESRKNHPSKASEINGDGDWPYSVSPQDMAALKLRLSMSRKLNDSLHAREEALAESVRLYDNVDRHFNKLSSTFAKLQQIPLPDREPTPPPAPPPDPDAQPRITLRVADRYGSRTPFGSMSNRRRKGVTYGMSRTARRIRRDEDWGDVPEAERALKRRGRRPGVGFQPKPLPPPPLTETGEPVDPLNLPWNRLMPIELARLRKRMKKNTQWTPSSTMILRELESLGRGIANKHKYQHQIDSGDYPHCSPEDGGIGSLATESNLMSTENRGMKLNAAKRKLKEAQAQALAAGKVSLAPEVSIDRDTKMEDSVVVGPSKPPVYGGKVMTPMGPIPTYHIDLSGPKSEAIPSSLPSIGAAPTTRGKDPEAMNSLKLRATSSLQPTVRVKPASPPPLPVPSLPPPQPPPLEIKPHTLPPQTQQSATIPELVPSTSKLPTSSPSPPKRSSSPETQKPLELPSSAQSPLSLTGHKRKRSSVSPPPVPSPQQSHSGNTKSSDSTLSPASAPTISPTTRKRGSVSAPAPAAAQEEDDSPSPTVQIPEDESAAAPPPQEPVKRRGRPPGSFKVGSARRKHAAKMAKLEANAEKAEALAAAASAASAASVAAAAAAAVAEQTIVKKDEEGEWEEDMEVNEHEPRYCFCNGVSHGLMLGCENDECKVQWFHLDCLGLTKPPPQKALWYCPLCREGGEEGNPTIKARSPAEKGVAKNQKKKRRKFK